MMRIDRGGARLLTLPAPTYSREVLEFDDYICEQLENPRALLRAAGNPRALRRRAVGGWLQRRRRPVKLG
eukprot:scaffold103133_cov63-Phaeocystis_antarctica.AAC.2